MKVKRILLLMSISIFFILLIPMVMVTGATNPPNVISYGDIVNVDHSVYTDDSMTTPIAIEYDLLINVSVDIEWHAGMIGLAQGTERAWRLNTPVDDCVHWIYIRAIYNWYPVPLPPETPMLEVIIEDMVDFIGTNIIGMAIAGVVILYLLSKILLK